MLNQKGTQKLSTERLLLRPFVEDDAAMMFRNWASDDRVTKFVRWPTHTSPDVTRNILKQWCASYSNPGYYHWAVVLNGEPIGAICVVSVNERDESVELGYNIGHSFWNNGYTTEAVQEIIRFLFEEVGVNRIQISHATGNPASGKVAQKCGLTFEGIRREAIKSKTGEFWDIADYSILRREWYPTK